MATATKEISIVSVVNLVTQVSQTIDFINDVGHLGELKNTMNTLVSALMPYLDVEKHDTVFYICTHGLIQSLTSLKQILVEAYDLQPPAESRCNLSFPTWNFTFLPALRCSSNSSQKGISHERKVELYRTDFLINHKILQFNALFPPHACSGTVDSLISDPEAKLFWTMCFSDKAVMVPWKTFFAAFEKYLHVCLQAEEEYFKNFLDFTQDNFVSAWEFSVFMKWFGPIKGCHTRLMEPVNNGILAGFIPACEATNLLQGRECGTFLVRLSKSHLDSFAITFVDHQLQTRHCLLYCAHPHGLTLNSPPNVYPSLMEFIRSHPQKLKHPLGKLIVSVSCKSRVKTCYRPSSPGKEPPLIFSPSSTTSYGEDLAACAPSGYINTSEPVPPSAPASFSSTFLPSAFCNCEQTQTTITTLPDEAGLNIPRKPSSNLSPKECSSESCVVCLDAPSETVFLECAHMCCCKICSVKLKQCPVCRGDIVRIIPVFRT